MMDGGCSQVQAFPGVVGHSLASHTEKQVGYLAGPEMKFGATLSLFILFFFCCETSISQIRVYLDF